MSNDRGELPEFDQGNGETPEPEKPAPEEKLEVRRSKLNGALNRPVGGDALNRPITADAWKEFLSLTGGSLLYCLSAACVIGGFMALMGADFARCFDLAGTLPVIAGLNVYELALLAVLLVIIVGHNVTDDAISLVVIAAVFLIVTGVALSTTAQSSPRWVLVIGAGCFLLAMGKVFALRRYIGMSVSPVLWAGLAVALGWNFMAAGRLAQLHAERDVAREYLLASWLVLLAGAALVLADAVLRMRDTVAPAGERPPFLRRPAMGWIFSLVLLVLAAVHQRALFHTYSVTPGDFDLLPVVSILSLIGVCLSLSLRRTPGVFEAVLACLPIVLFFGKLDGASVLPRPALDMQIFWYAPVYFGLTGLVALYAGMKSGCRPLAWAAAPYALGVVLTLTFRDATPEDLRWELAGGLIIAGMLVAGFVTRKIGLCAAAVILGAFGFAQTDVFERLTHQLGTYPACTALGIAGFAGLVVALIFGGKRGWLAIPAAVALEIFAVDFLARELTLRDIWSVAVFGLLAVAFIVRARHWPTIGVVAAPIAYRLVFVLTRIGAWAIVAVGFLLLFAGALVSIHKGRRAKAPGPGAEPPAAE